MTLYDQLRRKIPLADQLRSKATYRQQLNAAVRGLWLGPPKGTNAAQFEDAMQSAIDRGFRDAWKQGMEAVGLTFPDDMTAAEQAALFEAQAAEYGYIGGLAGAVMAGSKENGGKLSAFKVRIDLWVKRYLNIVNQAKLSVAADPVLEWGVHANESCTSCLKLNGQRRRSSVWREVLEVWPQHHDLECMQSADGPDVCQCTLNQTDKPPTRGRLPKWRVKHLAGSQFDHDQQTHGSGGGGGFDERARVSAQKVGEFFGVGVDFPLLHEDLEHLVMAKATRRPEMAVVINTDNTPEEWEELARWMEEQHKKKRLENIEFIENHIKELEESGNYTEVARDILTRKLETLKAETRQLVASNQSDFWEATIIHEYTHAVSEDTKTRQMFYSHVDIALGNGELTLADISSVSEYARTNHDELLAEVTTLIITEGRDAVNPAILNVYDQWFSFFETRR